MTAAPPTQTIGIDWSGERTAARQRRAIWCAVVRDGALVALEDGRTREEVLAHAMDLAGPHDGRTAIGLDFAFGLPAWWAAEQGVEDVWDWARRRRDEFGEAWTNAVPGALPEPFWFAKRGWRRPDLQEGQRHDRDTEEVVRAMGAPAKSVFQVSGPGAVGRQSLWGMTLLPGLRERGASIWPFDPPGWPLVVEVYPRLLQQQLFPHAPGRAAVVGAGGKTFWGGREGWRAALRANRDAFDACVAAWALWRGREGLAVLPVREGTEAVEGEIWHLPAGAHPAEGPAAPRLGPRFREALAFAAEAHAGQSGRAPTSRTAAVSLRSRRS